MDLKWYVVRAISGKERKAKECLESEIAYNGMSDLVSQILIPLEKVLQLKNGKKVIKERNILPGYILLEANLTVNPDLPSVITQTPNVIGFLGGEKPTPMRESEINRMLGKADQVAEQGETMVNPYRMGESVKVMDGNRQQLRQAIIMAKEITAFIKLQIKGGAANPAPPVGPALGSKGVNIMEFCKQFNARTQEKAGKVLPVVISVYADKSFDFIVKAPPVAVQLIDASKVAKGSAEPNRKKVGQVTWEQVKTIAEDKIQDMNAFKIESAMKMVAGTARSLGLTITGTAPWEV